MAIDYTQSPDEILVQLINEENGRNIKPADLNLNSLAIAPDPISGRPDFNNVRTSIGVAAAAQSGYKGAVTVKYNRVHVRQVFPNNDDPSTRYATTQDAYEPGEHTSLSQILPDINARHSINLKPDDIFDMDLPVFEGPPPYADSYVRLEMRSSHKIFVGGINIKIKPNPWDLVGLQFTELNGLLYPNGNQTNSDQVLANTSAAVSSQLSMMAAPGYWNYNSVAPSVNPI